MFLSSSTSRTYIVPAQRGTGKDGASSPYVLNWGTEHEEEVLESVANPPSPPRTIIAIFKGGGGGWEEPIARDPHKVLDDVPDEHVSIEQAEKQYVVIDSDTLKVDMEETIRRRARMAK
jgi:N-methylhydantoinase B